MHKLLLHFLCLAFATVALAQLPPPNDAGVAMGHLHITTKDPAAQMKFWVDLMGGTRARIGPLEVVKFPGVIVFFTKGNPSGGTKGSVINHLGFQVPDVPGWVARAKAAGGNIVTAAEVQQAKADFWFNPAVKTHQAFIMGPDEVKIEISEVPSLKAPIAHHHVHFYTVSDLDSKAWYAKMFSGIPGKRGPFECVDVPGVNLSFSKGEATLVPTKGRSLDHIGFEIKDLEAFCRKLESMGVKFDVPYKKVPAINSSIAFFTDPWGVYVELTEGLNKI